MNLSAMKLKVSRFFPNPSSIYITQPAFNTCFYAIRSFFALYVSWRFAVSEGEAMKVFSMFMALCYGTTLLGGYLADKGLGVKNSAVSGGILSILGLLCLFSPSPNLCFMGLSLFSVGSGLFKPNLMAAVGLSFEDPKDLRKGTAYSTVYTIGNLGIFALPIICGFAAEWYGWPYALAIVAGAVMGATFLVYKTMRFHPFYKEPAKTFSTITSVGIIALMILTVYILFSYKDAFNTVTLLSVCGSGIYMGTILYQCTPEERKDVWSAIGYILSFALFVAFFEQSGSSLLFFLKKAVDRDVMGWNMAPSAIQSLGPLFVLLVGCTLLPLFSHFMEKEGPVNGMVKVGCGFLFVAAGFFALAFGSVQEVGTLVPLLWVVLALFLKTIGELWIAPVSLSKVSQLAPQRFQSVLVSFWTMAIAYGHYLAGIIAQFSVKPDTAPEQDFSHYVNFFEALGTMALVIGLLVLVGRRIIPLILARLGYTLTPNA